MVDPERGDAEQRPDADVHGRVERHRPPAPAAHAVEADVADGRQRHGDHHRDDHERPPGQPGDDTGRGVVWRELRVMHADPR
jgi:hypothetical protein